MIMRYIVLAIGLATGLIFSNTATAAVSGWTTRSVNMRTCASIRCARILVIPAHVGLTVYSCNGWCSVSFAGRYGYVAARYVALGGYRRLPPPIYQLPPPIYRVPPPYYRWRYRDPRYRWHPPYRRWPGDPHYHWDRRYNWRLYEGR